MSELIPASDGKQVNGGAIAAGHPETVSAGAEMLRRGGNAVDAAVAAAVASFVAEASIVNIGGGGVALVVDGLHGTRTAYDFFSVMPSGHFTPDADFHQVLVDFGPEQQPFHIGRASAAVPGVVAGLCRMASVQGTLPLSTLLSPAVRLADEGAMLTTGLAYAYRILQPIFRATPELADLYTPDGRMYQVGERMRFPQLARTLEQLGAHGPELFYQGAIAQQIAADQQANHGLIQTEDLAGYTVLTAAPIRLPYRGYDVFLMPPSSLGGVLIAFALRLLEAVDVGALAHNETEHLCVLAEVMRLTNIARADWEQSNLPVSDRVSWLLADAVIGPYQERLLASLAEVTHELEPPPYAGSNDTTHISVVDRQGMQVSVTTSAGENAGFLVGDTGVCLNNMLGEADLHPHGFHTLSPGTRLITMMTPLVIERAGEPILAVGSGGSNRIRSAILQVVSNVLDFDCPLQQAVDAARIHFEAGILQAEGGVNSTVVKELRRAHYRVNAWSDHNMYFGGAHAVATEQGRLIAAGDSRRGGSTMVV